MLPLFPQKNGKRSKIIISVPQDWNLKSIWPQGAKSQGCTTIGRRIGAKSFHHRNNARNNVRHQLMRYEMPIILTMYQNEFSACPLTYTWIIYARRSEVIYSCNLQFPCSAVDEMARNLHRPHVSTAVQRLLVWTVGSTFTDSGVGEERTPRSVNAKAQWLQWTYCAKPRSWLCLAKWKMKMQKAKSENSENQN